MLYTLIEQAELRNKLIDRVDVLNKVKELFLIPKFEMMTTKMVAEYYGVTVESVKNVYKRHKDELDSDGMQCIPSSELSELHFAPLKIDRRIKKAWYQSLHKTICSKDLKVLGQNVLTGEKYSNKRMIHLATEKTVVCYCILSSA